jgi:hypothetical protein
VISYGESDSDIEVRGCIGGRGGFCLPKNVDITIRSNQVGPFNRASRADNTKGMNICMTEWGMETDHRPGRQLDSSSITGATPTSTSIFHDENLTLHAHESEESLPKRRPTWSAYHQKLVCHSGMHEMDTWSIF